MEGVAILQKH